jgi:putative transcriptional regulator
LNNRISEFRDKKKVTQTQMAIDLDITNDYLSMIERGARTPGFLLSKRIADYLDSSVDELFFNVQSNEMFDNED